MGEDLDPTASNGDLVAGAPPKEAAASPPAEVPSSETPVGPATPEATFTEAATSEEAAVAPSGLAANSVDNLAADLPAEKPPEAVVAGEQPALASVDFSNEAAASPVVVEKPTAEELANQQFPPVSFSNEKAETGPPKSPADFAEPTSPIDPQPIDGGTPPPAAPSELQHGSAETDPLVDKKAQEDGHYVLDAVGVEVAPGVQQAGKVSGPQQF